MFAHHSGGHLGTFLPPLHHPSSSFISPSATTMQCHHCAVTQPSSPIPWITANTSNQLVVQITSLTTPLPGLKPVHTVPAPRRFKSKPVAWPAGPPRTWLPLTSLASFSFCPCFMPSNAMLLWLLLFCRGSLPSPFRRWNSIQGHWLKG